MTFNLINGRRRLESNGQFMSKGWWGRCKEDCLRTKTIHRWNRRTTLKSFQSFSTGKGFVK